jgi:hypothetical protein
VNGELAERLDLDSGQLERTARATELYALEFISTQTDEETGAPQTRLLQSAALLTAAASYWILIDPHRSFSLFADAGNLYADLGRSFAYVASICGAVRQLPHLAALQIYPETDMGAEEANYLLLREAWNSALDIAQPDPAFGSNLRVDSGNRGAWPTGRLRIPQRSQLAVLRNSIELTDRWSSKEEIRYIGQDQFIRDLQSFLARADEQVEIAMSDHYHWRRLQSSLLPVEPEIVAVCAVAAASALATSGEEILGRINVPERAVIPLLLGTEIARTARQRGALNAGQ